MGSMHGQVSLAAVSQISVIHQAMNGCNKYKDSLKYKILINERSNKFQQQVFNNKFLFTPGPLRA